MLALGANDALITLIDTDSQLQSHWHAFFVLPTFGRVSLYLLRNTLATLHAHKKCTSMSQWILFLDHTIEKSGSIAF